jgi:hypothetical protein
VDTLDGHTILRHTGGMVAFASSIHVDLDSGVAAFASINAMQGYRPIAVTEYAVRLMRAQEESKSLPAPPAVADAQEVDSAAEFAGSYSSTDGRKLVFAAQGKRLALVAEGKTIPLQHRGESDEKARPPVIEVSFGPDWYVNAAYNGPREFHPPADFAALAGRYRSDSPWGGDAQAYILKDRLMLEGQPLVRIGAGLFRAGDEAWQPDTVEFHHIAEGKARLLKATGLDFWRVEVD